MPVIKQTRRVIVGPVGINRQSRAGEIENNALSELAGNISSIAFKNAADYADKKGIESAQAVDQATITTIDPVTKLPQAMKIPKGFGTIAAQAYERIVRGRYEDSVKSLIENKAAILEQQYELSSNPTASFEAGMKSFVEGLTSDFGEDQNSFKTAIIDYGQKYTDNGSTRLYMKKVDRDRAAAAAALKTKLENFVTTSTADIVLNGPTALDSIESPNNTKTTKIVQSGIDADLAGFTVPTVSGGSAVDGQKLSTATKQAFDQVRTVGLLGYYAGKLKKNELEQLTNWLKAGAATFPTNLSVEVQNVISEVAETTSFISINKYASEAHGIVNGIFDAVKTAETQEQVAIEQTFDDYSVSLSDRIDSVVNHPENVGRIVTHLNQTRSTLSAADNARGQANGINEEQFNQIHSKAGTQLAKALMVVSDSSLETVDSFQDALSALSMSNPMTALLTVNGLPPKEDKLLSAIESTFISLNEKGRDAFVSELNSYFTELVKNGDRKADVAIANGRRNLNEEIASFNNEDSNDLAVVGNIYDEISSSMNDLYKKNPEQQLVQQKNLNQSMTTNLLKQIAISSDIHLLSVETYLTTGNEAEVNGKKILLTPDTKAKLDLLREKIGQSSINETAVQSSIANWREANGRSLNQNKIDIADKNKINEVNLQSKLNFAINGIDNETDFAKADAIYWDTYRAVNEHRDFSPEGLAFKRKSFDLLKSTLARNKLSNSLKGLSVEELKQVQLGQPINRSEATLANIKEGMTSDKLKSEDIASVFAKSERAANDKLAESNRQKELIRFNQGKFTGTLTPDDRPAFNKVMFDTFGLDMKSSQDVMPLIKQIASGQNLSEEAKALQGSLNQIMPEPLMNAFKMRALGQDVSQMYNISNTELSLIWGRYAHRLNNSGRAGYTNALIDPMVDPETRETLDSILSLNGLGFPEERVNEYLLFKRGAKANLETALNTQAANAGHTDMLDLVSKNLSDNDFEIFAIQLSENDKVALQTDIAAQLSIGGDPDAIMADVSKRLNARVINDGFTVSGTGSKYTNTSFTQLHGTNRANNIVAQFLDVKLRALVPNYGTVIEPILTDGKIPETDRLWTANNNWKANFNLGFAEGIDTITAGVFNLSGQQEAAMSQRSGIKVVELPEGTISRPIYGVVKEDAFGNRTALMVGNTILKFDPNTPEILEAIMMDQTVAGEKASREKGWLESGADAVTDFWRNANPNPDQEGWGLR
jgi:hypothetical protein